jgi:hypothetical protein
MKKLLDLGFKKIPTEDGFTMYELTPAKLNSFDENFKAQATSNKLQASSGKQQAAGCDNMSHLHKKKTR